MSYYYYIKNINNIRHSFLLPNIHPAFVATLVAISGIIAQHLWTATIIITPLISLIVAYIFPGKKYSSHGIAYIIIFCLFAFRYEYQTEHHSFIGKQLTTKNHLTGTIVDIEQLPHSPQFNDRITASIQHTGSLWPWYIQVL